MCANQATTLCHRTKTKMRFKGEVRRCVFRGSELPDELLENDGSPSARTAVEHINVASLREMRSFATSNHLPRCLRQNANFKPNCKVREGWAAVTMPKDVLLKLAFGLLKLA